MAISPHQTLQHNSQQQWSDTDGDTSRTRCTGSRTSSHKIICVRRTRAQWHLYEDCMYGSSTVRKDTSSFNNSSSSDRKKDYFHKTDELAFLPITLTNCWTMIPKGKVSFALNVNPHWITRGSSALLSAASHFSLDSETWQREQKKHLRRRHTLRCGHVRWIL